MGRITMPRATLKSYDDQIKEIDNKIVQLQERINQLNNRKKALLASKEKEEMEALYQFVKASGKTPAELLAALTASTSSA